jgi:hypothetical protein
MPDPITDPNTDPNPLVDNDGNFTEAFTTKLPEFLGDDHKDFKGFDGVTNIGTLAKMYADTKTMVGRKLENVIQKPGENATDQEKADYIKAINEARGVPADPTGYAFDKSGLPEDIAIGDQEEQFWKDAFYKAGVDAQGSNVLFDAYKQARVQEMQALQQAQQEAFEAEANTLKSAWKGDAMIENPRLAVNAIKGFADEATKAALDKAGVFNDPTNLKKWMDIGISPNQLLMWGKIGHAMKGGKVLNDAGTPDNSDSPRGKAMQLYPNSPELWPAE